MGGMLAHRVGQGASMDTGLIPGRGRGQLFSPVCPCHQAV